jgi:hypothetical protein
MKLNNPNEPATKRQLWYLHILTKGDTRNLQITKVEASKRIELARAKILLKNEIVIQPKPEPSKSKPRRKANLKPKSSIKVKAKASVKSNGFDCWHCHNGYGHEELAINGHPYLLCGCGATTTILPRLKVSYNRRGGVRSVIFTKPFVSSITSADRNAMIPLPTK